MDGNEGRGGGGGNGSTGVADTGGVGRLSSSCISIMVSGHGGFPAEEVRTVACDRGCGSMALSTVVECPVCKLGDVVAWFHKC